MSLPTTQKIIPQNQDSEVFAGLPLIPPNDPSLEAAEDMAVARAVRNSFLAASKSEGVGAKVRRSIGVPNLRNFTPFLMLDHFEIPASAGFPDHPHRGIETVTYLLSGSVDHEDFAGNRGTIGPGDLQFMTAGKGIIHAEMPGKTVDGSANVGLQLWVDLPKSLKSCEPRYRDMKASEIPIDTSDDGKVTIKVIAGKTKNGVESQQNLSYTPVWLLDVTIRPGGKFIQPLPQGWNVFSYQFEGGAVNWGNDQRVENYHIATFEQHGDRVIGEVPETAIEASRFILAAGMPLKQEIVQYGPFVSTTPEGIYDAMRDYQTYSNGFEKARDWESEIGKRMVH